MRDYLYISSDIKTHDDFIENMKSVLYAAEKHGIVFGQMIENKDSQINAAKKYLPEYAVTETVNTDCCMIKQSVTALFGTPGEICKTSKEALRDYLDKINDYGYSAVNACHAFYFKENCGQVQAEIDSGNPVARFLTLLDDEYYPKKRVLFECTTLFPIHCGTSEVMLASFEAFNRLYGDKYDITILTTRRAAQFHKLADKYDNIVYPDTIKDIYHLGYSPVQTHYYQSQQLLNKHCLKIVQLVHDIIMVRSGRLHGNTARANIELGAKFSDGLIFISNFSRNDFFAYYFNMVTENNGILTKVIYDAKQPAKPGDKEYNLPFDDYFLITGNTFRHKAINDTVNAVIDTKENYIVIGAGKEGRISKNIYGYKSGKLDEGFINYLYKKCKAVIFPSLYEGFGLPVVMSIQNGKKVIVNDNELNRELYGYFAEYRENFLFYKTFSDISDIIMNTDLKSQISTLKSQINNNTWDRAAEELDEFFTQILEKEPDAEKLKQRLWTYSQIEDKSVSQQFGDYKLSKLLRFSIKENIKHRHPKIHKILSRR